MALDAPGSTVSFTLFQLLCSVLVAKITCSQSGESVIPLLLSLTPASIYIIVQNATLRNGAVATGHAMLIGRANALHSILVRIVLCIATLL